MRRRGRVRGLSRIDVLMLIGILTSLGVMLFPWLQSARENARREVCTHHMKQLVVAYLNYESRNNRLVSSSGVTRNAEGKIQAVDGWSWMVQILPFMEDWEDEGEHQLNVQAQILSYRLDLKNGKPLQEPADSKGTPHADALTTRFPWLICPSFGGSPYADPSTMKEAITNYHPLGATHYESLSVASPYPMTPKYNPDGIPRNPKSHPIHPDGICFPGLQISIEQVTQGTANQVLFTESLEPRFARWTVGAEAAMVGLPSNVEYELRQNKEQPNWAPLGFESIIKDRAQSNAIYWSYHTYLDWDYDKNPYDGQDGSHRGKYGPSSHHPGVVNHAFVDGSIHSISVDADVYVYMRIINSNNVVSIDSPY